MATGDSEDEVSRQYRDFETYLIPAATFEAMRQEPLPLAIDTNLPSYTAKCRKRFEENLATVARKAREKTLSDVSIIDGDLRISPLRKNTHRNPPRPSLRRSLP
jgi:hypothetical protein